MILEIQHTNCIV